MSNMLQQSWVTREEVVWLKNNQTIKPNFKYLGMSGKVQILLMRLECELTGALRSLISKPSDVLGAYVTIRVG